MIGFEVKKDSAIRFRINSFLKREFQDLLKERGISITDFFEKKVMDELRKEGRTIIVKIDPQKIIQE
jgi:hypothetical protein